MRHPHLLLAFIAGFGLVGVAACELGEDCEDSDGDEDCGNDGDENPSATTSTSTGQMTLSCNTYCADVMANCTAANGAAQYETAEDCMAVCAFFPMGSASDTSGNTLGCRASRAGAAEAAPAANCAAAGPGGDGVCGNNCDGYCQIALAACTGPNEVYTSASDCQADCAAHGTDVKYDVTKDSGNQQACLLSHATAAPLVPEDHCVADLNMTTDTCKDPVGG